MRRNLKSRIAVPASLIVAAGIIAVTVVRIAPGPEGWRGLWFGAGCAAWFLAGTGFERSRHREPASERP